MAADRLSLFVRHLFNLENFKNFESFKADTQLIVGNYDNEVIADLTWPICQKPEGRSMVAKYFAPRKLSKANIRNGVGIFAGDGVDARIVNAVAI